MAKNRWVFVVKFFHLYVCGVILGPLALFHWFFGAHLCCRQHQILHHELRFIGLSKCHPPTRGLFRTRGDSGGYRRLGGTGFLQGNWIVGFIFHGFQIDVFFEAIGPQNHE